MNSDIPQHIATCIASVKKEHFENCQRVTNLGKSLISEYELDKSTDTLLRWLIHYIAEKFDLLSNSEGQDKTIIEQQCVDAILKVWSSRDFLPNGIRPFENFDPILRGLARLDNQSSNRYYNQFNQFDEDLADDENKVTKEWVNIAIKIDEAAKALVDESFKIAAEYAKDQKTKEFLQNAPKLSDIDIRIIRKFYNEEENQPTEAELIEMRKEDLKTKLARIKTLGEICNQYTKRIENELGKL